jgi:hypothetical protein
MSMGSSWLSAPLLLSLLILSSAQAAEVPSLELASLNGEHADYATDADRDGLYDFLTVEVGLDVLSPGEYSIMAYLYDENGSEIVWSVDHQNLSVGERRMRLDFDGKALQRHGSDGPYLLRDLRLVKGSSPTYLFVCDREAEPYSTSFYRARDFVDPSPDSQIVSGRGYGELLLTFTVNTSVPAFSGRYSYDVLGINIPPLSSPFKVSGSETGYAYTMDSLYLPNKPNDFSVIAYGVKDLNIGLKKIQGERTRVWVSSQAPADENGVASSESDLLSPGPYHVKIFGQAKDNATIVNLTMAAKKKVVADGPFNLTINTTGFPEGDFALKVEALNGSFKLSELELKG